MNRGALGRGARPREEAIEPGLPDATRTVPFVQMRALQRMRKVLAETEVALARQLLLAAQHSLQRAREELLDHASRVARQREQAVRDEMAAPVQIRRLRAWRERELGLLADMAQRHERLQDDRERVRRAELDLAERIQRRRIAHLRHEKFDLLLDELSDD